MLIRSYKIVEPKRFEIFLENIEAKQGEALVQIEHSAICKADLRYYLGDRDRRVLGLKYPLSLLHEAIGMVVKDPSEKFHIGDKVVLIPNIVRKRCLDCTCDRPDLGENFCPNAQFASSTIDGFSKEIVSHPVNNLLKINPDIYSDIFVFSELLSVSVAALRKTAVQKNSRVLVFGDGIVGFFICHALTALLGCSVSVVGKHMNRLERFSMCEQAYLYEDLPLTPYDIGFECIGGKGAAQAIDTMIDQAAIGANIVLTGVSPHNIPINTRKILEKGLLLSGTTRSNTADFETALKLLNKKEFREVLHPLILGHMPITDVEGYYQAFEREISHKELGKYILES